MEKKEDKKPATKTAQCFVCLRPVQIRVDSPKGGIVICDPCWAKHQKEMQDLKKKP